MKLKAALLSGFCVALWMIAGGEATAARDFFVAPDGYDSNPGTEARPFRSLERARQRLRTLKGLEGLPEGGVTVWLRGGTYELRRTFALTEEDSGTAAAPIVYRAYPGEEVRLSGGREIGGFTPVREPAIRERLPESARDPVLQTDLKAQGVTDFGALYAAGVQRRDVRPAPLELFFQGQRMTLAQWPNQGWAKVAEASPEGGFIYEGDRPQGWITAEEIWLRGFWAIGYGESWERVRSLDPETRHITTYDPQPTYGYRNPNRWRGRYRALNLLEELDQPGAWYLDRQSGVLYFWPPAPLEQGRAAVSLLEEPLVFLEEVSHVTLRGLILENTRGQGLRMEGGSHNLVAGCTVRGTGGCGVEIRGGTDHGVVSCDLHHTGREGLRMTGGDWKTLIPGGHYALNNHIHHCGEYVMATMVYMNGVGQRISHNLIHHGPLLGIHYGGNDHLIELNEMHHVGLEGDDVGVVYTGRSWIGRGKVIRYNYFHHMGQPGWDVRCVYLDDGMSGVTVYGNVFYQAGMGVCLGGGRDNTVENNLFVDCTPAVSIDARGLNWARESFGEGGVLLKHLLEVNYTQPPYSERYPELLNILEDEPARPKGNALLRNVCVGQWLTIVEGVPEGILKLEDNWTKGDPGFVDAEHENFQLRDDSPVYELGFQRIPMEKIGLYRDEYRAELPAQVGS